MSASKQRAFLRLCPRCKAPLRSGEGTCYSCGFQVMTVQPKSTVQPARSPLTYRPGKGPSGPEKNRAAFYYFISIFIAIILITFIALHASGVSLATFTSKAATPTATIQYPTPQGAPIFSDNFLNDIGWNLQSSPGNYAVAINNSALTMQVNKNKLLWELLPGERSFSNFTLTVNAMLSQGDQNNGYGVYIRGAANSKSDLATYYRFELYGDGSYAIFKGTTDASGNSTATKLVDYTLSSAIQKQGRVNHIMIIAKGAALSFIDNDQLLKTVTDSSYTSGSIALFVSNLPQAKPGATAQFSNLAIYPVH